MPKIDQSELKGFAFAGIAAIALANSFIFSKLCFEELDFFQFGFWWFLIGTLWNGFYILLYNKGQIRIARWWYKSLNIPLISVALLEAIATGLFYFAILSMVNPGVVSFIGNIGPVFVTILGFIFLKETFSRVQFMGILIALCGIFLLNYKGYGSISQILIPGSQYVIIASFIFSIAAIIARKNHNIINAGILSLLRAIMLFITFLLLISLDGNFVIPTKKTFLFLAAGSFLEVFITIVFAYLSFKYIKAFKTSITISTKGLFAMLGSWLFLNLEPGFYEMAGGVLSLAGVYLVSKK
jgi:drug/metabolite transporter (DMT)-like permease